MGAIAQLAANLTRHWRLAGTISLLVLLTAAQARASDVPLATLHPTVFTLEPGSNGTPIPATAKFPGGDSHPALLLKYQSRITYDVPTGQSIFQGVLFRAPAGVGANGPPEDINRIQVRFLIDGKDTYDSVLDTTMPPEQFGIPLSSARKLTIEVNQMLAGGAVYLADAVFTSRSVLLAPYTRHRLLPGSGYANFGSGVRQVGFRTFHPGELIPLQLEFAGSAATASVSLTITAARPDSVPTEIRLPVTFHAEGPGLIGTSSWQVPSLLGPSLLDLSATINGKLVYRREVNIAIARNVQLASDSLSSTFGVHLSTSGIPYLTDRAADIWGANWARVALRWEVVEFTPGQYDWRSIDELVDIYLQQGFRILGVLGEIAPKWADPSGPATVAAFNRFVKATVEHLQGKISYWDVYNEIDSKYHGGTVVDKNDSTADIRMLRDEMSAIRAIQPTAKLVCCSTGTSYWLVYDKRLYDNGLLKLIDILSSHPYQSGAPELREGPLSYFDIISDFRNLEHAYAVDKPIWSTEANWLIGPEGQKGVTAPYVDEHSQAEYVVRVNLLSMALGVPYFLHSPFFTPFHRELFLDSIASYANMTYNFGRSTNAKMLSLPDGVYGVAARTGSKTIGAFWTTRASARIKIAGMSNLNFQDFYGNPVALDAAKVSLSGAPIYVTGVGSPSVTVEQVAPAAAATALPNPWMWEKAILRKYTRTENGVRVTTGRVNYADLLTSAKVDVLPNSCYVVSAKIHTFSGGVALVAMDSATGKRLGETIHIFNVTGNENYEPGLQIKTASISQIQIRLIADNPNNTEVTDFEISRPQISPCGGP